jgi:tetratricopeptide (TPR) repeat protein
MLFGGETAESYYDEGVTASMKGDLEQAVRHFEKTLELDPAFITASHQLGKCYMRMGEPRKAIQTLQEVVRKKPHLVPPRIDLGYALLDIGAAGKALPIFQEIAAKQPANARAQLGIGLCVFQEGRWQDAMIKAREAIDQGSASFTAFFLMGRASRLAGFPEAGMEGFQRAESLLEKSIETSPDQPEGYYLRGEICMARDEAGKALEHYSKAEELAEPEVHYSAFGEHFVRTDILAKRGLCLQRVGQREAAREVGRKILQEDPGHRIGKTLAAPEPEEGAS